MNHILKDLTEKIDAGQPQTGAFLWVLGVKKIEQQKATFITFPIILVG